MKKTKNRSKKPGSSRADLRAIKVHCTAFRKRLKARGVKPSRFADLVGSSRSAAYRWQSAGSDCVAPPPMALTLMHLMEESSDCLRILEESL